MRYPDLATRDLVLIGAGHTNLHIVRQWRLHPIPDVQLTLVTPFSRATYSGMLPGTLAGLYQPEEMQIDLYRLTTGTGIRLIIADATGLDPDTRLITLENRPPLRFDVASIGIGSIPNQSKLWRSSPRVLSIKPMATFLDRLRRTLANTKVTGRPVRCAIVGSGAAGTEITFCLDAMLSKAQLDREITLLDHHAEILPGYASNLVRNARKLLKERGIAVRLGQAALSIEEVSPQEAYLNLEPPRVPVDPVPAGASRGALPPKRVAGAVQENTSINRHSSSAFDTETSLPVDFVIWATSAQPPDALRGVRLPKDSDGFLSVHATLQTTAMAPVFVVGDSASFVDQSVPKAGVYAVREGPILWENLQRQFTNRPLISYRPQQGYLSLLSTGEGQAFLQYYGWTTHGTWAWWLKDHIDRRFMRMYQEIQPPMSQWNLFSSISNRVASKRQRNVPAPMHCGGCGSKIGANLLSDVLRRIRESEPETAHALSQPDDAYVIPITVPRPDVFSIDYFRSFLDDPYVLGRIAVLHALSDIWAMGASPAGVQALVTLPYGASAKQGELLFQLLSGAVTELTAHRISLWGGHTTAGPELQLGFSVAGNLGDQTPWRKSGLMAGDLLILTKPLGTGVLLAACPQGKCRAEWMDCALAEMLHGNADAMRIGRQFPVHAATDITGFGLAGHLSEMLTASNCSAVINFTALGALLLPGFAELVKQGVQSSLAPANRELESQIQIAAELRQTATFSALFDPQTSGGLLFGIAEQYADGLLTALKHAGCDKSAIVGRVTLTTPETRQIRCEPE